jgi:hypothetical protein
MKKKKIQYECAIKFQRHVQMKVDIKWDSGTLTILGPIMKNQPIENMK